ncbi:endopeptidase La [Lujinxingia litoralis]|uniref:Lon protease n=1 Tax=Lujinxingia litoralis TaxID=2211119 RepID=A0A328C3A3_9DELT|nr:endopeptidase La [Lujinxingia litoralis]RAL21241.1 endopeptidase La [Lujinxingia litoralis]
MASSNEQRTGSDPTATLPLLPLRDILVFPAMKVPLFVGREKSIAALDEAMKRDRQIVLAAQKKAKTNEPGEDDIYEVATLATIDQLFRLPDGTVKVRVIGQQRVQLDEYLETAEYFEVRFSLLEDQSAALDDELKALLQTLRSSFAEYVELNKRIPGEMIEEIARVKDPSLLADTIAAQLALKLSDKQSILEMLDVTERLRQLYELMQEEIELLKVEKKIRSRVKKQMERTQNDYYLNDMQGAMPKDPNDQNEFKNEIDELEERIQQKDISEEAQEKLERELKKLKMMSPMSAEATVVRNYIDWVLSLPWGEYTEDRLDVKVAEETLEADHYGLEKPKDRILEYLAVKALIRKPRGPILCLVGPPGVGKTSLGRSIARAINRKFVRLSLGGVRDEAEIRGHRRTYIGALPGKIIQSLRKAGSSNPVLLLDEVDKMSTDFRGDPSSALLEVLDPEQNATFNDHYLDLDYDLSDVMFLCTANNLQQIPAPLRDRMEIIQIPGYTDYEKLQIARHYLVPKQLENNGIDDVDVHFTESAISRVINDYTREAGVRNLEREIGTVCRKIARKVVEGGKDQSFNVNARAVTHYLGHSKFTQGRIEERDEVGMTNGVAWTQYGGVMLVSEVSVMPGKGKFIITGKLGDVMQESAQAAMSYVRSRAMNLGLSPDFHQKVDLHIHFPEGALPKDGPSAGITMATSIVSALTRIPVQHDVAMTGEITLRGRVLPIGGLKEKAIAAQRGGIRKIIAPMENKRDWPEVPKKVRKQLEVVWVDHMDEVLAHALRLEDRDAFQEALKQPLLPPDILLNQPPGDGATPVH